ncbi:hypothetical protein FQA39_LY09400 [Lamprigera yunnana]|nr:hypothetical protein FQA39_LY09400 [Lamprigera yunnana]
MMKSVLYVYFLFGHLGAYNANYVFPDYFQFGVGTSAYQIEGAWNEDGKGENIWDRMIHTTRDTIRDNSTGDVACDSYHKYKEDVLIMKDLGLQFYRFSISWSRILPTGLRNVVNQAGIDYYNNLINELLKNNIKPVVTMYHFDLPQPLQDLGGWANNEIIDWFVDYTKILFEHFGDRVKLWITINEPKQVCLFGYGFGYFAPGLFSDGIAHYLCGHNVLKAHGRAFHLYDKYYRPKQKGKIGITVECAWVEALTDTKEDVAAAERKREFDFGIYTNPIFNKNGDYPKVVKDYIKRKSIQEGFSKSRLPTFTTEEIEMLRGSSDFFGLNHYSTFKVKHKIYNKNDKYTYDNEADLEVNDGYLGSQWLDTYFRLNPNGFRQLLKFIKTHYGNPEVLILENGTPDLGGLDDQDRVKQLRGALNTVLKSIHEDNVNITHYTTWTLFDNFEWLNGYTLKFGIYQVNFTDSSRARTPKASAKLFKKIIAARTVTDDKTEL